MESVAVPLQHFPRLHGNPSGINVAWEISLVGASVFRVEQEPSTDILGQLGSCRGAVELN
jgi:hypothetical protein